ncbi:PRC-barrel domain-containing protein [Sabulicella glaciei]|uniref:PRC-barrel domain-containing protein n=1 Tax=Sabulicella glaciei TaxID=2984948 RepID=A0ABT3NYI1_9PROT|nr:PRC-barrel domain-containing protein [Roseococcus sp. MDT2-1-1]MCW8087225.1 PRC-barrel domain-containing protein [Roseococcus sp. MDT2-1-1]
MTKMTRAEGRHVSIPALPGRAALLAGAAAFSLMAGGAFAQGTTAPSGAGAPPQASPTQGTGQTGATGQTGMGQMGAAGQTGTTGQAGAQGGASQQAGMADQLRAVEQSLRNSGEQLNAAQAGQTPNFDQARAAVQAGQQVLGRVPQNAQGQDSFRNAQRELSEAQQAMQGGQPDRQQVATQLREAADSFGALMRGMGGTASAQGTTGQQQVAVQQGQAQVNVQQPAPQITVQQPQPQITVQQPPPQVTINQPPPQVTINQPEPRVTVQQQQPQVRVQQAEPQVTVQQPGEPQVRVQQSGQPQVTTEGGRNTQQAQQGSQPGQTNQGGAANVQRTVSPGAATNLQSAQSLIGTNVVGSNGRDAGEVRNLVVDSSGQVRAALVEWGGFLGLGTREALVPIDRIRMGQGNERATLNMTREELERLPRYESNRLAEQGREQGWGDNLRLAR